MLGVAMAAGDLVEPDMSSLKEANFTGGLYLRKAISPNVGVRLSVLQGRLTGDDNNYENRKARGHSFSLDLTEVAITADYDILGHQRYDSQGGFRRVLSPYVFVGIGMAFGKADVVLVGDRPGVKEDINNLANRSGNHLTVPFGAGLKWNINQQWMIGAEAGFRPVFHDYLDGVSISGDNETNDWYGVGTLNLIYQFGSQQK